jgi:phage tail protein X
MTQTYVTKQGDTFDSIAHHILGHRRYTRELMEANPQYLKVVIFSGNITLVIPDITKAVSKVNLPPWRRDE